MDAKKLLIIVGVVVVILIIAAVVVVFSLVKKNSPVTLTYWGQWEPESVYQTVIADYKRLHPNVTVNYSRQSQQQYRERLSSALSGNNGPDIFRIHNTWLPMFISQMAPVPSDVYSQASFKSSFYPTAVNDLTAGGRPYAIPLAMDTLEMFVNEDIFSKANLSVPTIWQGPGGVDDVAQRLTVKDNNGRITTSGAAIGNSANVDHWQDILSLMMLQSTVNVDKGENSDNAQKALNFYGSFASTFRTWDETLDVSTLAFAEGKVAIYFGPSWRYFDFVDFKQKSNPNLNFKMVAVPQLTGADTVNFATYWAEAVNKKSAHQTEAWDFLKFLSSKDELTKLYNEEAKIRAFGEVYARPDMAGMLSSYPTNIVTDALKTAKSSYLSSKTWDGDTGINSRYSKYYGDAVAKVSRGGDARGVLDTVSSGVAQILSDFGFR